MDGCIAVHSNDFLYNVKGNWNLKNHFCLKNKEVIFWGDLSCFRGTSTYLFWWLWALNFVHLPTIFASALHIVLCQIVLKSSKCSNFNIFKCSTFLMFQCSNNQMFKFSNIKMFKCLNVQIFKYSNVPIFQRFNVPMFQWSNVQMFKCWNI